MMALKRRDRRLTNAIAGYWGAGADPMRMRLALEDAKFVAGVTCMVGDHLGLSGADRRRVVSAAVRQRVLGERDGALTDVDDAWQAWWPPAPGDVGRATLQHFLTAWRDYLAETP